MAEQNFANHTRYYIPHHFIFYPAAMIFIAWAYHEERQQPDQQTLWIAVIGLTVLIIWVSFMLRQHYALSNQNRIVRLEMRFRYYILTQKRLEPVEDRLSFGQLAALRFSSDEELPTLLQKAIDENLTPDQIKKQIKHWQPDLMRV